MSYSTYLILTTHLKKLFKHLNIWDFTCHDTFTPSYLRVLPIEEGSVSKKAEDDKDLNNRSMTNEFHFVPICLETMGVGGPKGYRFILKRSGKTDIR